MGINLKNQKKMKFLILVALLASVNAEFFQDAKCTKISTGVKTHWASDGEVEKLNAEECHAYESDHSSLTLCDPDGITTEFYENTKCADPIASSHKFYYGECTK